MIETHVGAGAQTGSRRLCSEEPRGLQRRVICNLLSFSVLASTQLPKKLDFTCFLLQPDIIIRLFCDSVCLSLKVGTAPNLVGLLLLLGAWKDAEPDRIKKPSERRCLLRLSGILCENTFTPLARGTSPANFHLDSGLEIHFKCLTIFRVLN